MKALLFLIALYSFNIQGFAQEQVETQLVETTDVKPTDWVSYFTNENFTIEYKFMNCDPSMGYDYESVLLKFTNKTDKKLELNWHLYLHYNGECRTCDYPDEYSYELTVDPNQSIEGDCSIAPGYTLKLFSKFIDANYTKGASLTAFKLAKLKVTQIL